LEEAIGKGAFGTVYKAINTDNGTFAAIKRISLANVPKEEVSSIMVRWECTRVLADPTLA
jgi:serine/threonine protein kinase